MKVELLVNLKTASGRIVEAGTIFSDEENPIPPSILKRVTRGTARVISTTPSPVAKEKPVVQETKIAEKKESVIVKKEEPDKPIVKKTILRGKGK